jgi:hypothetical protein
VRHQGDAQSLRDGPLAKSQLITRSRCLGNKKPRLQNRGVLSCVIFSRMKTRGAAAPLVFLDTPFRLLRRIYSGKSPKANCLHQISSGKTKSDEGRVTSRLHHHTFGKKRGGMLLPLTAQVKPPAELQVPV